MNRLNHVFLRVMDTCNLECAHCYSSCGPRAKSKLELRNVLDIVEQLGDVQAKHVHLEGGEALIYKGIWDVIDALNGRGIRPAITSNGLVVKAETLDRLRGKVSKLTFSVDGHNASVHDQIRRKLGSFERVTSAIRASVERGIPTHMISVMWKRNVDHVDEQIALAEALGVDRLLLFSCGRIGAAIENWEELAADFGSWQRYLYRIRELTKDRPWVWFEVDRLTPQDLPFFIDDHYEAICTRSPRDSITIDPLGDVYPCGYFIPVKKSLGNVLEKPLKEIVWAEQDGERYSGACKDPWKTTKDGTVELCKLYSINHEMLPAPVSLGETL